MTKRYMRLQKNGDTQYVRLLRDREYYRKLKLPKPLGAEFYLQGDLTDRVYGQTPFGYDTVNSLNGYTGGGDDLCVIKDVDGLVLNEKFGNVMKGELVSWEKYIPVGHVGYTLDVYTPYHFKATMLEDNKIYVRSTGSLSGITAENPYVTMRFKYRQTKGTQFGVKIYGATWIGGETSHVEISTGEWTDYAMTFDFTNHLNRGAITFEPIYQTGTLELEVKDIMVQHGNKISSQEFTETVQPTNCKLQYVIPSCIPANNYVLAATFRGYNTSSGYPYLVTFNEDSAGNATRGLCFSTPLFNLPIDKDINIVIIRNDIYKIGFLQCDGIVYEVNSLGEYGVRSHIQYNDDLPLGTKMTIGVQGNIDHHHMNTKLKNYYIGRFNGTEWQDEDGTVNKEYLFKYFMNNGVFDIPPIGEDRLVQNSYLKNTEDSLYQVFVDTTLEIID